MYLSHYSKKDYIFFQNSFLFIIQRKKNSPISFSIYPPNYIKIKKNTVGE